MLEKINEIRNKYERLRGQEIQIKSNISLKEKEILRIKKDIKNTEFAQRIIQIVAQQTQQELEFHISDLVSLVLENICDDPYKFKVDFILKRGRTEAECFFIRNEEKIHPYKEAGGGIIDITSFALRIALWNLSTKKISNTIILDEPFKWVQTKEYQLRISKMLKLLSEKFGIQFIIVSQAGHKEEFLDCADKIFNVYIKKGISGIHQNETT